MVMGGGGTGLHTPPSHPHLPPCPSLTTHPTPFYPTCTYPSCLYSLPALCPAYYLAAWLGGWVDRTALTDMVILLLALYLFAHGTAHTCTTLPRLTLPAAPMPGNSTHTITLFSSPIKQDKDRQDRQTDMPLYLLFGLETDRTGMEGTMSGKEHVWQLAGRGVLGILCLSWEEVACQRLPFISFKNILGLW